MRWTCFHLKKLAFTHLFRLTICDRCQTQLKLHSSRIVCIECSEGEFSDTLDLCPNCQTESFYRESGKKSHKLSHPVIQLRWVVLYFQINSIMSHAKSRLKALSDEGAKYCTYCRKELQERLYWYCTQCEGASEFS